MAELLHIKANSTINCLRFLLKKSYNEGVKNDSIAVSVVRVNAEDHKGGFYIGE